jgi:hypothetical protein
VSTGVRLEWPFQFPARTAMDVGTAPESPPGAAAKARGCSAPRPSTLYFTSSDINDEELTSKRCRHVPKLPCADGSWHMPPHRCSQAPDDRTDTERRHGISGKGCHGPVPPPTPPFRQEVPSTERAERIRVLQLSVFGFFSTGAKITAERSTIEMNDRELFAAMAMQALITRGEKWASDLIAKQAVAYADALIQALEALAPKGSDLSGET